jgi:Domain of unknown function (DUF4337)
MEPEELQEKTEHAMHTGQKAVGLTTAIVAVLLATVSLLSHRSHTEAVLLQGRVVDEWNFYQAKHGRAHDYGIGASLALLQPNGKDTAIEDLKQSEEEECGAPRAENCATPARKYKVLQPLLQEIAEARKAGKSDEAATKKTGDQASGEPPAGPTKEKPAKQAAVKEGAVKIQEHAYELEAEQHLAEKRADHYDTAELFLEISIVLCSIALLSEAKLYWRVSFITTAIGVGVAIWGFLLR